MRIKLSISLLAIAALCFLTGMEPVRGESDCTVDGTYQSDWGVVHLKQVDDKVTGKWQRGTIKGVRKDDVIRYTWYEGPAVGGKGRWKVSSDCSRLSGTWGTGSQSSGGGKWNLHK